MVGLTKKNLGRVDARGLNFHESIESCSHRNTAWKVTYAFFVIMGGFHCYQDGKPLYPLSPEDVLKLINDGALVPPTLKELKDRSKGDALLKGVAIVQTLWFVMQCIARRIKHLPLTSLKVMTLAYTVITMAMYTAWWCKPLNVRCPVRVPGMAAPPPPPEHESIWRRMFYVVIGNQDRLVKLNQEIRVPTFWAHCESKYVGIADAIALVVAMAFGAVHCVAWSYAFPSHAELLMWRVSAISIVAVPVAMLLNTLVGLLIGLKFQTLGSIIMYCSLILCSVVYITARLILLVLFFTTLRFLHFGEYQAVQWTNFFPHL